MSESDKIRMSSPPKKRYTQEVPPIIPYKRERHVATAKKTLQNWIETHIEERPGRRVGIDGLYDAYVGLCQSSFTSAVDLVDFNRTIKKQFPSGYGCKESSALHSSLVERKIAVKNPNLVKADSLKLKTKNIIENVINDVGNPSRGFMYKKLKSMIANKYPAHQIEHRQDRLLNALEKGVAYGQIELLRGAGACGIYRLPGPPENEEKDKSEENGTKEKESDGKEKINKKDDKTKDEEEKENVEGGDEEVKKKKRKKDGPPAPINIHKIIHSSPKRVIETFPLAITFGSEPKESSFRKILKYVQQYYHKLANEDRLRKVFERGLEKGLWSLVRGTTFGGTVELTVSEFDPGNDENLDNVICTAIVATNEPKIASIIGIRDYITDYHGDNFKIEKHPYVLRAALQRAEDTGFIRRVSGIGMHGSIQLSHTFTPTPAMMIGEDTGETSEEEYEDFAAAEKYKPRPTKRHARRQAAGAHRYDPQEEDERSHYSPQKAKKRKPLNRNKISNRPARSKGKISYNQDSSEESEEETKPPKRQGRNKSTKRHQDSDESESEEDSDAGEKYKPRPAKHVRKEAKSKAKAKNPKRQVKSKSTKSRGDSSESEAELPVSRGRRTRDRRSSASSDNSEPRPAKREEAKRKTKANKVSRSTVSSKVKKNKVDSRRSSGRGKNQSSQEDSDPEINVKTKGKSPKKMLHKDSESENDDSKHGSESEGYTTAEEYTEVKSKASPRKSPVKGTPKSRATKGKKTTTRRSSRR